MPGWMPQRISKGHGFHLVDPRPWPFLTGLTAIGVAAGLVDWLGDHNCVPVLATSLRLLCLISGLWWRDVIRERVYQGRHTSLVKRGLKAGFVLFLLSETCFFASLFWAFFHSSLAPTFHRGNCWPPAGISPLNPWEVPLLNTAVLLASGVSLTWFHHGLRVGCRVVTPPAIFITCALGLYFTSLQYEEYLAASFSMADRVYGSLFYMITGFHGLHVIIGTAFLLVCFIRLLMSHFARGGRVGVAAAVWY